MKITKEYLINHGFTPDRPDDILCRFVKTPEDARYRIVVEQIYKTLKAELTWEIDVWNCNEKGAIVRRASVTYTDNISDLESVIKLAQITDYTFTNE